MYQQSGSSDAVTDYYGHGITVQRGFFLPVVSMRAYTCICVFCVCVYMCIYVCVCVYVYICVGMCIYMRRYMCIYLYVYV